jgi:hypothetical protein
MCLLIAALALMIAPKSGNWQRRKSRPEPARRPSLIDLTGDRWGSDCFWK